jgi:hypothetical protein
MKKHIAYAVTAFFAAIVVSLAAPPDKSALEAREKAAWQAFKDKDAAAFQKVVDKDLRAVYDDGIQNMAKELSSMKQWDMKSFTFSDYDMFSDEKDIAVTTYTVKVEGTVNGKDASGTYNAGSVWKLENGQWMAIFHTNIMQAGAGATTASSPAATP